MATSTETLDSPKKKSGGIVGVFNKVLVVIGKSVGGVVAVLYQSGRETIDMVIKTSCRSWRSCRS